MLMDNINDHRFDEAELKSQEYFVITSYGTKHRRQTMQGVNLCIKWHNGNTAWVALKDIKEAPPVQLEEYAVESKI